MTPRLGVPNARLARYRAMHVAFAPLASIPLLLAAPAGAAPPRFDPIAFFAGHTEGTGRLKVVLDGPRAIDVHGYGHVERDGTITLRQTVEQAGKDPNRREWRIREVSPGRYAGTLTDAAGPVTGETIGNRLRLGYRMRGGLHAEQWLDAAPDGRSARNRMTVSRMGVPVARLDETIRRTGP